MVHKKYTYKNGKVYGPYLYENKRVKGKVVTNYLGKSIHSKTSYSFYLALAILIVAIAGVLLFMKLSSPTGRIVTDLQTHYTSDRT